MIHHGKGEHPIEEYVENKSHQDIDENIDKMDNCCEHTHSDCCSHHHHHHENSHHHHHHHHHHHDASQNLGFAFFLNVFFAIVELVGGILTQSVAIMSDALHDFGDSISLGVAWRLQKLSKKGSDAKFSYGYKRFSLLGAMLISVILLVGSLIIVYTSVNKLFHPGNPKAGGMILLAVFGLFINGWAALRLSKGHSLSERSVMLHMMEDVFGWAAVLIVAIVMYFVKIPILDPILSLCIAIWILYNVYFNLKETLRILLQGVPLDIDKSEIQKNISSIMGVKSTHDLHIWTLDGENHVASIHVVYDYTIIDDPSKISKLKSDIRTLVRKEGIQHLTIELDPKGCDCGMTHCCD